MSDIDQGIFMSCKCIFIEIGIYLALVISNVVIPICILNPKILHYQQQSSQVLQRTFNILSILCVTQINTTSKPDTMRGQSWYHDRFQKVLFQPQSFCWLPACSAVCISTQQVQKLSKGADYRKHKSVPCVCRTQQSSPKILTPLKSVVKSLLTSVQPEFHPHFAAVQTNCLVL